MCLLPIDLKVLNLFIFCSVQLRHRPTQRGQGNEIGFRRVQRRERRFHPDLRSSDRDPERNRGAILHLLRWITLFRWPETGN